jgi:large subunit ribosomal protein L31e
MAKAQKTEAKLLERTYTIPLRREFSKVPGWRRTKKAVKAVHEFLEKHMKSNTIKLSPTLNEKIWNHGGKNPPHHVKVTVTKDAEGKVEAELFGVQKKEVKSPKKTPKAVPKKESAPEKTKEEASTEQVEKTALPPVNKNPEDAVQKTDKANVQSQDQK